MFKELGCQFSFICLICYHNTENSKLNWQIEQKQLKVMRTNPTKIQLLIIDILEIFSFRNNSSLILCQNHEIFKASSWKCLMFSILYYFEEGINKIKMPQTANNRPSRTCMIYGQKWSMGSRTVKNSQHSQKWTKT